MASPSTRVDTSWTVRQSETAGADISLVIKIGTQDHLPRAIRFHTAGDYVFEFNENGTTVQTTFSALAGELLPICPSLCDSTTTSGQKFLALY